MSKASASQTSSSQQSKFLASHHVSVGASSSRARWSQFGLLKSALALVGFLLRSTWLSSFCNGRVLHWLCFWFAIDFGFCLSSFPFLLLICRCSTVPSGSLWVLRTCIILAWVRLAFTDRNVQLIIHLGSAG